MKTKLKKSNALQFDPARWKERSMLCETSVPSVLGLTFCRVLKHALASKIPDEFK